MLKPAIATRSGLESHPLRVVRYTSDKAPLAWPDPAHVIFAPNKSKDYENDKSGVCIWHNRPAAYVHQVLRLSGERQVKRGKYRVAIFWLPW